MGFPPALSCPLSLLRLPPAPPSVASYRAPFMFASQEGAGLLCCPHAHASTLLQDEGVSGELHSWGSHAQGMALILHASPSAMLTVTVGRGCA